jgi:DNA modification methylase
MSTYYDISTISQLTLREQLRLFAFTDVSAPPSEFLIRIKNELSKKERLATLLQGELNFHGEDSGYASHDLHAFAAKFPPQLPRAFIRSLTSPGDVVFDPMMGSGTTIVEALLENRQGIGLDIDPLALRLCQVKTTSVDIDSLRNSGLHIISRATELLSNERNIDNELETRFDKQTKEFLDYWFFSTTQRELMALVLAIQEINNETIRHFLELTFSAIIITKSGGVSKARDLAHTRPHLDINKKPKNAIEQFFQKFKKNLVSISSLKVTNLKALVLKGDARCIPLAKDSIDLIVTSPPYANAIDYMRAHKFSLVWFGASVQVLSELRAQYIGSERLGHSIYTPLPKIAEQIIIQLNERDYRKTAILRKYFGEIRLAFSEMHRVLRKEGVAIVVVGTSMMRNLDVQTHVCLADIASGIGFDVVGVVQRTLDRNKRMMPARFGKKSDSMIEQRMHEEYVIGLIKP